MRKRIDKKGVSPVIATILLVSIVIVIGLIIFLWFQNIQEEAITKFGETNIALVCGEVLFNVDYDSNTLYISNTGNVPIFSMKIKTTKKGSHETKDINDLTDNWNQGGLTKGNVFSDTINFDADVEEITVIPVLIGNSEKGKRSFVCDERTQGYDLII